MSNVSPSALDQASRIKLAIFDVDGVLTDGRLIYSENGIESKAFNSQDGLGMKYLQRAGIIVSIITGRRSAIVDQRMKELGVLHVYQGCDDKQRTFEQLLAALDLQEDQAAYIGDDLIDVPVMRRCGFAATVPNAHPDVPEHAHWVTPRAGGAGAGRDFCDLLLRAGGHYDELIGELIGR